MQFNGTPEEWGALVKKNRQTIMKLYTEEQVKDMLNGPMFEYHIVDFLNTYYTPIELPSDEEIEKMLGSNVHDYYKGAKWMRDKILNK